jgi:hypothetical protein
VRSICGTTCSLIHRVGVVPQAHGQPVLAAIQPPTALRAVTVFAVAVQLAALPFLVAVRRRVAAGQPR